MLDEAPVACANIQGLKRSPFISQGERGDAEDASLLFKTDAAMTGLAITQWPRSLMC
jgi:hypothetical protein